MRIGRSGPSLGAVLLLVALVTIGVRGCNEGGGDRDAGEGLGEQVRAEVLDVVDGDTIEVSLDGKVEDVRYIGVDTPESVTPGEPVECFGEAASRENERLVEGETVRLVFDAERRDRYGRLLAYVHVGDVFVNGELIAGGFARTLEIEPNTSRAERLGRLETAAGREGRGLWTACEPRSMCEPLPRCKGPL
jgi:micrococcal nuclease